VRGNSAVGSRYQATTGEDLVRAAMNCRMYKLAIALELLAVMRCVYKWSINPITNPNPV
jgi:hypothetical protein